MRAPRKSCEPRVPRLRLGCFFPRRSTMVSRVLHLLAPLCLLTLPAMAQLGPNPLAPASPASVQAAPAPSGSYLATLTGFDDRNAFAAAACGPLTLIDF